MNHLQLSMKNARFWKVFKKGVFPFQKLSNENLFFTFPIYIRDFFFLVKNNNFLNIFMYGFGNKLGTMYILVRYYVPKLNMNSKRGVENE